MTLILTLLIAGTVLIFIETVFVGGILGLLGALCYIWAVCKTYLDCGAVAGVFVGILCLLLSVVAFLVWLYVIPKTKLGKNLYLNTSQTGKAPMPKTSELVGMEGVAFTLLAPSGKVNVNGNLYDAKVESGHIESGAKVRVVSSTSFEILVEKI